MTPVFALAFDHRNSFRRDFMHLTAEPTPEQHAAMVAAKGVVVDALLAAAPEVGAGLVVLLIDQEYGGELVPRAQAGGIRVAMPVEVSGQRELRFVDEGQPDRVVVSCHPDYVKVLIRYNPGGDTAMNARQRQRLRELAGLLRGRTAQLMLELLVPPEESQLAAVAGRPRAVRSRAAGGADRSGDRGDRRRRHPPGAVENRRAGVAGRRGADSRGGALGRSGRRVPRPRPRRRLRRGPALAGHRGGDRWLHRVRRRPDHLVGRASRLCGSGGDRDTAVRAVAARYLDLVRDYQAMIPARTAG